MAYPYSANSYGQPPPPGPGPYGYQGQNYPPQGPQGGFPPPNQQGSSGSQYQAASSKFGNGGGSASDYYRQSGSHAPSQQQPPNPYGAPSPYPPQPGPQGPGGYPSYQDPRASWHSVNSYQQPPVQGFSAPPNPGFQAPGQYPPQPSSSYGPPGGPPGPYGGTYPPNQGFPPQQSAFGAAPYGQPCPPTPGYEDPPVVGPGQFYPQAEALRGAMKGFGTNEAQLIGVLSSLNTPYAVLSTQKAFAQRYNRDLIQDLKSETSGRFEDAILAIARGPLMQEVYALYGAIHRPGTAESVLNDVLLCRSPADLSAIIKAYNTHFKRSLEADVRGDLSLKTEDMFVFALQARRSEDNMPVEMSQIEKDAYNMHYALQGIGSAVPFGIGGTNQEAVYSVILSRNDAQIGAIAYSYERMFSARLETVIEKRFSGHMQQALLFAVRGGIDKAGRDASLLEETMRGLGTKDTLLIHRIIKLHWNKPHFENVKKAYYDRYSRTLEDAVYSETSGDYRKLLLAVIRAQ